MKHLIVFVATFLNILSSFSQIKYDKVEEYGKIKSDWAVVWKNAKAGVINKQETELLSPIYTTIGVFDDKYCNCTFLKKGKSILMADDQGRIMPATDTISISKYKRFVREKLINKLNTNLFSTKEMDWKFTGTMSVDSFFSVNEAGILSATIRYKNDSTFYRVRMEAPLNKASSIELDIYMVLMFREQDVQVFTSDYGSDQLIYRENINLFHLGVPVIGNEADFVDELQHLLKMYNLFEGK